MMENIYELPNFSQLVGYDGRDRLKEELGFIHDTECSPTSE